MTDLLQRRLHATAARASLDSFAVQPFAYYQTEDGDTCARIAARYWGADRATLGPLIAVANLATPGAVFPAGVVLVIPDPRWRAVLP